MHAKESGTGILTALHALYQFSYDLQHNILCFQPCCHCIGKLHSPLTPLQWKLVSITELGGSLRPEEKLVGQGEDLGFEEQYHDAADGWLLQRSQNKSVQECCNGPTTILFSDKLVFQNMEI